MVKSISTKNGSPVVASDVDSYDVVNTEFWSFGRLRAVQRSDPGVSYILKLMESSTEAAVEFSLLSTRRCSCTVGHVVEIESLEQRATKKFRVT